MENKQNLNQASTPDNKNSFGKIKKPKSNLSLNIILSFLLIFSTALAGFFYWQNMRLKSMLAENIKQEATSTPIPTPTATPDPTANWKTYTNTAYKYSIKYPQTFKTQVLAAGAGEKKEVPPDARNLFIYNPETEDPYLNRYINLEFLQLEPTYGSKWTKSEVSLADKSAIKLVDSSQASKFDIYLVQLDNNQGVLEIYISNTPDKESLSKQILSTFKFINK